jgi:hypothetical protein
MSNADPPVRPATAGEIRAVVGALDDSVVAGILALGATREEVLEAWTWFGSDDYLHRELHRAPGGRTAAIVDLLEAELPEPDRP